MMQSKLLFTYVASRSFLKGIGNLIRSFPSLSQMTGNDQTVGKLFSYSLISGSMRHSFIFSLKKLTLSLGLSVFVSTIWSRTSFKVSCQTALWCSSPNLEKLLFCLRDLMISFALPYYIFRILEAVQQENLKSKTMISSQNRFFKLMRHRLLLASFWADLRTLLLVVPREIVVLPLLFCSCLVFIVNLFYFIIS